MSTPATPLVTHSNWFVTFFHRVEAVLKKLFTNTTWEHTAQATISYVAPIVETILSLTVGTGVEKVVENIISIVQSDLATVSAVVQGAQVTPGSTIATTVTTALESVKTNLAGILQLAEVKSSASVAKVESTVNLIVQEVEALLANLPKA